MLDRLPPEILILCMLWAREDSWMIALTCTSIMNVFMSHPFQLRAYTITPNETLDGNDLEVVVEYHKSRQDGLKYQRMMMESYLRIWKSQVGLHPPVVWMNGYNRPIVVVSFKVDQQRRLQQYGRLSMMKVSLERLCVQNARNPARQPLMLLSQVQNELLKPKII